MVFVGTGLAWAEVIIHWSLWWHGLGKSNRWPCSAWAILWIGDIDRLAWTYGYFKAINSKLLQPKDTCFPIIFYGLGLLSTSLGDIWSNHRSPCSPLWVNQFRPQPQGYALREQMKGFPKCSIRLARDTLCSSRQLLAQACHLLHFT